MSPKSSLIYKRRGDDVKGHASHDVLFNWYSHISVEGRVE